MQYFFKGFKTKPENWLYGLYQPSFNCFLILYDELDIIKEIKKISSSRYSSFMVQVDCAPNYDHTLLDNHCCENWSLDNVEEIASTYPFDMTVTKAKDLLPIINQNSEVIAEKEYLQKILYWTLFIKWLTSQIQWVEFYTFIDELNLHTFDNDYWKEYLNFSKQVKKILYLSVTENEADEKISTLLSQHQDIEKLYNLWTKSYYI